MEKIAALELNVVNLERKNAVAVPESVNAGEADDKNKAARGSLIGR